MGQEPMTRHLSNLINGRTEGNILNSKKALLSAYEQVFSAQDTNERVLIKNYIPSTFMRHKAGTLQNILIVIFGLAMLFPRWCPVLHKLLRIQPAQCTLARAKALRAPSIQTERLMTSSLGQASTSRRTSPK